MNPLVGGREGDGERERAEGEGRREGGKERPGESERGRQMEKTGRDMSENRGRG